MKIVARHLRHPFQRPEFFSFDRALAIGVLKNALDDQAGGADDDRSLIAEELRADDRLRHPGFIFQREKNESFGRPWTLSYNDCSGSRDTSSIRNAFQIARGDDVVTF